ncbi:hypothetical protein PYV02_15230 [Leifsonia sp. H3M29-4]|uniref:hypothetical protein n=1 Tax=Salinibacterium metalliresistens TaxID=3031321 RepID=UPI0023DC54D1|nr:hypothetical protein [Salinibacterium metalliresistens]MDF1480433.1 hypothetical protein [Salinibacterium metalliresistens]
MREVLRIGLAAIIAAGATLLLSALAEVEWWTGYWFWVVVGATLAAIIGWIVSMVPGRARGERGVAFTISRDAAYWVLQPEQHRMIYDVRWRVGNGFLASDGAITPYGRLDLHRDGIRSQIRIQAVDGAKLELWWIDGEPHHAAVELDQSMRRLKVRPGVGEEPPPLAGGYSGPINGQTV